MKSISRRNIIKKLAYTCPVILTLIATPAFAGKGSNVPKGRSERNKGKSDWSMKILKHKKENI